MCAKEYKKNQPHFCFIRQAHDPLQIVRCASSRWESGGYWRFNGMGALVNPLSLQLQYFLSDTRILDTRDDLTC
jgi:hypothetical protein